MNKNILMVCYYYPPLKDVGGIRSVAFSRYFRKFGWSPNVISVKNPDTGWCRLGNDAPPPGIPTEYTYSLVNIARFVGRANGLLSRILNLFGVHLRSDQNILYEIFCIPDYFWGWIPLTTIRCWRLIKKLKTDIIYVSCSPFSSAVIGVLLKLLTGRPLVMDFRDPFGLESLMIRNGAPRFRIRINRFIEDIFFKNADILIVTSDETREAYIRQNPYIKDKMFTVHNGFDAAYMIRQRAAKYQKFTITYNGEFYFYLLKSQVFFEALSLLKSKGKIDHSTFQFLFYGDGKDAIESIAHDYGIEDLVVANSRIPYKDVLSVLSKSHLQLLRIVKPMISTKFFEGIPLNVPFLATIPSGEVEGLIRKYSPSSYVVTEDLAETVADAIVDAMSQYATGGIRDNHVEEFMKNFSRENLTLKLISIFEKKLPGMSEACARPKNSVTEIL